MSANLKLSSGNYASPDSKVIEIESSYSIMQASVGTGEGEQIDDGGVD